MLAITFIHHLTKIHDCIPPDFRENIQIIRATKPVIVPGASQHSNNNNNNINNNNNNNQRCKAGLSKNLKLPKIL